ncbi:sensor histidine kinase [Anaeromicropila populeti]|uniref:histidine kinase n=1 Tax=Anaeromicropila populeti TaxID=37658 RepID=A0A1I6J1Y9_9FIRM|nr:sensor histidine kinase [Anaeromicropila populeti]SFR73012.1 hypothetical protein SAMN05661086_01372 [Anaeromicropila populeti]
MRLVCTYIKDRIKMGLVFCSCALLILLNHFLYQQSFQVIIFSLQLCGAVSGCAVILDFIKYRKKHLELQQFYAHAPLFEMSQLPKGNLLEQDYQVLLKQLSDYNRKLEEQMASRQEEQMEYYSMWIHQIKTPIAAMHLLIQLAEEGSYKKEMGQELFKVEQYVEMVLQFQRLDSLSSDLFLKSLELQDVIKQAVKKYSVLFIRKKIALELEDIQEVIVSDEKWLVYVLEQLISNALKYTMEGSIRIYMDSEEKKSLVIEDTGIGIREEDIPRIFDRGFTGYNGRMDKKSTGIGLYLCKQILDKLGHTIWVESELGKGTKFILNLEESRLEFFS